MEKIIVKLKNGGWLEGEITLEKSYCSCPCCTCPPTWMRWMGRYNADGKSLGLTSCGSDKTTEEEALIDLTEMLNQFATIINKDQ